MYELTRRSPEFKTESGSIRPAGNRSKESARGPQAIRSRWSRRAAAGNDQEDRTAQVAPATVALLIARPEDRPLCCSIPAGKIHISGPGHLPGDHDQDRPTRASGTHHPPPPARKNRTRSPVASAGDRFVGQVVVWADALTLRTSSVPAPLRPVPAPLRSSPSAFATLTGLVCRPGECDPPPAFSPDRRLEDIGPPDGRTSAPPLVGTSIASGGPGRRTPAG